MNTQVPNAKINGKFVDGRAHLQPKPNRWIGIFKVKGDLLDVQLEDWKSATVHYEGLFHCVNGSADGTGEAKIIFTSPVDNGQVQIHVEGRSKPKLKNGNQKGCYAAATTY